MRPVAHAAHDLNRTAAQLRDWVCRILGVQDILGLGAVPALVVCMPDLAPFREVRVAWGKG